MAGQESLLATRISPAITALSLFKTLVRADRDLAEVLGRFSHWGSLS